MNLPVASFTFLNTWENICPHQAARRFIVKDLPREPETPEMKWGNEVHDAMEKRLYKVRDLTPEMPYEHFVKQVKDLVTQPEMKLGVTAEGRACGFWDAPVWLRGKLDAPMVTGAGMAGLWDWKTGKVREDPYELEVQAVLLQARYPTVRIIKGAYVWLRENRVGETHDLSDTARTWTRIQRTMDEVKEAIEAREFEKRRGPLCGWCPVRDCEHNRRKT